MMIWHDGKFLPQDQLCFKDNQLDRGLQYGDGFFTTLLLSEGQVVNWPEHLKRLQVSAERLKFQNFDIKALVLDFSNFLQSVSTLEQANHALLAVKILVTRGIGGKGYQPPEATQENANWLFQIMPYPTVGGHSVRKWLAAQDNDLKNTDLENIDPAWQIFPQRLTVSDVTLSQQPLLAGLKHLNRLENVLARQALMETSFDEAVMCDSTGDVISATQSNLLWFSGKTLYTPSLDQSGVQGTTLSVVLELAKSLGCQIQIGRFSLRVLNEADEIFLCNALRGVMPVISFSQDSIESKLSSEKTTRLAYHWWQWLSDNKTSARHLLNKLEA